MGLSQQAAAGCRKDVHLVDRMWQVIAALNSVPIGITAGEPDSGAASSNFG
jgi:hypothetical protein